jgi:hypothetical protein
MSRSGCTASSVGLSSLVDDECWRPRTPGRGGGYRRSLVIHRCRQASGSRTSPTTAGATATAASAPISHGGAAIDRATETTMKGRNTPTVASFKTPKKFPSASAAALRRFRYSRRSARLATVITMPGVSQNAGSLCGGGGDLRVGAKNVRNGSQDGSQRHASAAKCKVAGSAGLGASGALRGGRSVHVHRSCGVAIAVRDITYRRVRVIRRAGQVPAMIAIDPPTATTAAKSVGHHCWTA